jgi:hypothetical protein
MDRRKSGIQTEPIRQLPLKQPHGNDFKKYGNHFGSTYDSIITQILDEKEGKENPLVS